MSTRKLLQWRKIPYYHPTIISELSYACEAYSFGNIIRTHMGAFSININDTPHLSEKENLMIDHFILSNNIIFDTFKEAENALLEIATMTGHKIIDETLEIYL